jgi:prepilin-type N-terminal cleavage/methylation domain-containing protein
MNMGRILKKRNRGLTLIEVMVAAAAILVVLIGAMSFQMYCARDARRADVRAVAGRLGLLLLENWRSIQGTDTFDPLAVLNYYPAEFTIVNDAGNDGGSGYEPALRRFVVRVENIYVDYHVTLSYSDSDPLDGLRNLVVCVAWRSRYTLPALDEEVNVMTRAHYVPPPP